MGVIKFLKDAVGLPEDRLVPSGKPNIDMLVAEIDRLIKRNEKQFISSPVAFLNPDVKEVAQNINMVLRAALIAYGGVRYASTDD